MDLVNRLKHYMDASQVSISQFSDRCGIPRPTMSQMLNGRNKRISDEVINKIHNAFPNLSILWLMFGEGQMELVPNIETSEAQKPSVNNKLQGQAPNTHIDSSQAPPTEPYTEYDATNAPLENSLFESPTPPKPPTLYSGLEDSAAKENILFDENRPAYNPAATVTQQPSVQNSTQARTQNDFPTSTFHPYPGQTPMTNGSVNNPSSNDITRTLGHNPPGNTSPSGDGKAEIETDHIGRRISISPDAHKKITNIVVFYSDNSFQSFLPDL